MKVAILGMIQSGKSVLLSAISGKAATVSGSNTIAEAVVAVPDQRLDWLTELYKPKKTVRATIDCLDLPGFSFEDQSGRQGARKLVSQVRTVDMFVLVVRAFKDDTVPAYRGGVDPRRDVGELLSELLLTDLELVATRIEKLELQIKKGGKSVAQDREELELQLKLQEALESEKPLSTVSINDREEELLRSLGLLTLKPITVVVNVGEDDLDTIFDFKGLLDPAVPVVSFSARLESELAQLDTESRVEFMKDLGLTSSAAEKFIQGCYSALGLISFLTVGPDEVRAWPIKAGISALDAAGKIHSDIKRGFIRAETMSYADLKELGDEKAVKAAGKMRLEGKTYIVQDGDIMNFRFNV